MLKHYSQFNLKPECDNDETLSIMFTRAKELPVAESVRIYRQICTNNPYRYCIEIGFPNDDLSTLDAYLHNSTHDTFCEEVWYRYVQNSLDMNLVQAF